jgi:hypothetical protein
MDPLRRMLAEVRMIASIKATGRAMTRMFASIATDHDTSSKSARRIRPMRSNAVSVVLKEHMP